MRMLAGFVTPVNSAENYRIQHVGMLALTSSRGSATGSEVSIQIQTSHVTARQITQVP